MADGVTLNPGVGGALVDTETNASRANAQMQRMKMVLGAIDTDGGDVSPTNPMPTTQASVTFQFSTLNTTTAQLAAGTSFVGAGESILSQPTISVLLTCDQPYVITINQYIDAAGLQLASSWAFTQAAGQPFSQAFTANGNYCNIVVKNLGLIPTTTLNLNTAYGTLAPVDQYGHQPVSSYDGLGNPLASQLYPGIAANGGPGYALQVDPTNAYTDAGPYVPGSQVGVSAGRDPTGVVRSGATSIIGAQSVAEGPGPLLDMFRALLIEQRITNTLLREALFPGRTQAAIDQLDVMRTDEDLNLQQQGQ